MRRVSTYTILKDIVSYSSKDHVGKYITLKYIPYKTGGPLKDKDTLEY